MSVRDYKLLSAGKRSSKKRPVLSYTDQLEASIISAEKKDLKSDFTDKLVNEMLYDLIGKPGKSAGKAQEKMNQSMGVTGGVSSSAYTSAQMDVPESGSPGTGVALGAGIIRDLLGYVHSDVAAMKAYDRQNEFYDNHLSMPAKVEEYHQAGLNPMGLAGSGPGATSAPQVDQGATPQGSSAVDVLGQLLQYKLGKAQLAVQEKGIDAEIAERAQRTEYQRKINEWFDTTQVVTLNKMQAETEHALELINSEKVKQQLDASGISVNEAEAALKFEQAITAAIHNKYADAWERNTLALQRAQANQANSTAAYNYEGINNLIQERQNMIYEGLKIVADTHTADAYAAVLGYQGEQLKFAVDHQQGDLVFHKSYSVFPE